MADEAQYNSHKRKYEEDTSPPRQRRPTGFSDGPLPPSAAPYSNVPPPPANDFELMKQKVQELASRAIQQKDGGYYSNANTFSSDQRPIVSNIQVGGAANNYSGGSSSKMIEIPNGRVGVIIGKAGETIKNLQNQSGARIQVTRDGEHDPNQPFRMVELKGSQDQIATAEQLIKEVLAEAEAGGPGSVSRRMAGASGSEPCILKVPNNKVGLVIGKGGETIKNIQSKSGARVQVIPLHPPPGEAPMERIVQIDGTSEQIEIAKQMVNEVIENRLRNPAMTGGYSQQNYQARPTTNWAPQPSKMQQPGGYGYMQQPGVYPGAPSQYNQQSYPGYPPQNWDHSSAPQNRQSQGSGYDYYGQQQPPTQQQQTPNVPQTGNSGYNYNQPPTSAAYSQQGYSQEGYGAGYQGYDQQPTNPQPEYDQRQDYGSTPGYGNATNPSAQDGHTPAYGSQGESGQPQQGYMGSQPSPNPAYPTHNTTQSGYGVPPTSQPSYGTPPVPQGGYVSGYGNQGQKTPPNPSAYGQPQQSPSQAGGFAPPAASQSGYPPSQAPAQTGAAATYGGGSVTTQQGGYPQAYGAPPVIQPSYGQQPYYGGGYSQPAACPAEDNGVGAAASVPVPASQPAAQPNVAAEKSPLS